MVEERQIFEATRFVKRRPIADHARSFICQLLFVERKFEASMKDMRSEFQFSDCDKFTAIHIHKFVIGTCSKATMSNLGYPANLHICHLYV